MFIVVALLSMLLGGACALVLRQCLRLASTQRLRAPKPASKARRPELPRIFDEPSDEWDAPSSRSDVLRLVEPDCETEEPSVAMPFIDVKAAAVTDRGAVRTRNEDAVIEAATEGLFVVADGMGGHTAGDVASRLAAEAVAKSITESASEGWLPKRGASPSPVGRVVAAIEEAHRVVRDESKRRGKGDDMGTTVVALHVLRRRGQVVVAHVGDSRCYRWRDGTLDRLTVDHTLVPAGTGGPLSSVLRRAIGFGSRAKVDTRLARAKVGDRFLLCSDGLNRVVPDRRIAPVLSQGDPADVAAALVALAHEGGAPDNVSVVVVDVVSS